MQWVRRGSFAILLLFLMLFPFGPLFPWSPVWPGYAVEKLQRADVLYEEGTVLDPAYRNVDRYIAEAEQFHGLHVDKRLTVVDCRSWDDLRRFMPYNYSRALGGVTVATGTVIYISPKLREKNLDAGEYLRHEISHATLNQNQAVWNALRMGRQAWFTEGVAVLFGRQRAFVTAKEFTDRAKKDDLQPVFSGAPTPDMRFAYQAWRYFWDYELRMAGRERFYRFQSGCLKDPDGCRKSFASVYGMQVADAVTRFQEDVRAGRFQAID
ncbi:MAG: hypothetical protein JWP63_4014 [Candidatus Solibacter sp.]|nr:hypothetical protein [Candidatus Solibacter sp.]